MYYSIKYRTPEVEDRTEAIKLCQKNSRIYKFAEKYCRKDGDCDSPLVDIRIINNN